MANLLKVVFLGLAGFGLLVFFTAEKPKQIIANDNVVNIVKYNSLPKEFELVGKDGKIKKNLYLNRIKKLL